jgi:hypothetical protein
MTVRRFGAFRVAAAIVGAACFFANPSISADDNSSCPISLSKQVESVQAFSKMMPVFRHPRCKNCHGGMDIRSGDHPGAAVIEEKTEVREFLNQCQDCHDGLPPHGNQFGWMQPGSPLFFIKENGEDKSDEELCLQIKEREKSGEEFVAHIEKDHDESNTQFIRAAFKGDRALGEQGLKDHSLVVEKPPLSQGKLTELAREWTKILGDGYKSAKCGCVLKLEGKFTYTDSGELGSNSNVTKVTGNLIWKPEESGKSSPTFTDAKSNFLRPTDGEITIESSFDNRGVSGSSCKGTGQRTFAVGSLRKGALREMLLELAEDGRYKLTLVIPDTPDPFPLWKYDAVCTWPNTSSRQAVEVRNVSVALGRQLGTVDSEQGIVGQLETPLRRGPRTITANWSFKSPES